MCVVGIVSIGFSGIKFMEEFIGRNVEGIFLKDAANDDHGMSSEDIHNDTPAMAIEVVDADDRVVVFGEDVIEFGFVFDDIGDAGEGFESPFHIAHEPGEAVFVAIAFEDCLESLDHALAVEETIFQVGILPVANFELAGTFRGIDIDAGGAASAEVFLTIAGVDDVKQFLAPVESFLKEGHEDLVLFLSRVEKSADVPGLLEGAPGEANGRCCGG